MLDLDAKEFIEDHLPGSLTALTDLARTQLWRYSIALTSISGMQAHNGAFRQVAMRLMTPRGDHADQTAIYEWCVLHRLKVESIRLDSCAQEFVLFVRPPVPLMAKHAE